MNVVELNDNSSEFQHEPTIPNSSKQVASKQCLNHSSSSANLNDLTAGNAEKRFEPQKVS